MALGKVDGYVEKNNIRTFSNTIHKTNSKQIRSLNVRPETIKLLEENIRGTLSDLSHSNIFLDLSPKAKETKAKIKVNHRM